MAKAEDASGPTQVVVTREFDAPVELVWKAWTESELVMRWWGPDRFSCPIAKMDFRKGGTSIVCMRAPQEFGGQDTYSAWTYRKIVPFQLIDFIQNLVDQKGARIDPTSVGLPPDFPKDMRTVVAFEVMGKKTRMTVTEFGWKKSQMFDFAVMGMNQCMDKMIKALETYP